MSNNASRAPREMYLQFSPPCIDEDDIQEVIDTLRSDWITTGPKASRFEESFAEYVGAAGALALNSCTAAMHVALVTLGIGPGDEVITSPYTFAATVNVIEHVGAKPVLVDVEADTLNIDPRATERAVSTRTRAIMPVHFAGHPADLDRLYDTARDHSLDVIEDAAHALPATYRGKLIGSGPGMTAYSFYATKNLTTAEGGMLVGTPEQLQRARMISLHGMSRDGWKRYAKGGSWKYDIVMPGFKYNMTDIQAALGLSQLRKLRQFHARRAEIARQYTAAFGTTQVFETPTERDDVIHAWHLYPLRLVAGALRIGRDEFVEELAARNIGTSVHFIPVHMHSYYRDKYGYEPEDFPVAHDSFKRMISLPLHPKLSDEDIQDVIDAVLTIAERAEA